MVVVCVAKIIIPKNHPYTEYFITSSNIPKTGDIEKYNLLISGVLAVVGIGVSAVVGMNSASPIENKYSNKLSNIWYYKNCNCKLCFIEITNFT